MAKSLHQITFDFGSPGEESREPELILDGVTQSGPDSIGPDTGGEIIIEATHAQEEPRKTSPRGRKSLKEQALSGLQPEVPDDELLFSKHYYSMGEVAAMFHENQSLIRYWETEFDILQPKKNRKGDRFFRPVDVRNLELIYDLLRRRKFTIEGAREYLKTNKMAEARFAMIRSLEQIKSFLLELKAGL